MIRLETKYDINREVAKISALSLPKIDKYEYLNSEKTLHSNESQRIEHTRFAYIPLGKAF